MTTALSDETKQFIRLALRSHDHCAHVEASLCYLLIGVEVEYRLGGPLNEDEFTALGAYVADCVLEGLILKGMVEPCAVDEAGELVFGITDAGKDAHSRFKEGEEV